MTLDERARVHAALGDPHRLAMVDALSLGDLSFQELTAIVGLAGNLAAHHLGILESAGLVDRHVSEGDRRRRYISLRRARLGDLWSAGPVPDGFVVFVCTHNSARSQFAAARWRQRTGLEADSAGTAPADRVHPKAVRAAAEYGLDLRAAVPKGYGALARPADLVVSVCDRAHETGVPSAAASAHWSIPDPVRAGTMGAFRSAFATIDARIDQLAGGRGAPRRA
jgi:protein-tyrosine-phosphatase